MEFRKFIENEIIQVQGNSYVKSDVLRKYDVLEKKYQNDERWQSCVGNGYDTAIEMGYKNSNDFDLVAKIFAISTAR